MYAQRLLEHILSGHLSGWVKFPGKAADRAEAGGLGFELMARINDSFSENGKRNIWFRHLDEDEDIRVRAHCDFQPFLEEIYGRLYIPRQILTVTESGKRVEEHSVFSANLDNDQGLAFITPCWTDLTMSIIWPAILTPFAGKATDELFSALIWPMAGRGPSGRPFNPAWMSSFDRAAACRPDHELMRAYGADHLHRLNNNENPPEIRRHLIRHLPGHAIPRKIKATEKIPVSAAGKYDNMAICCDTLDS